VFQIPSNPDEHVSWRDMLRITRAALGILLPPIAITMTVVMLALATIVVYTISRPWALLPLALLLLFLGLLVLWDRTKRRRTIDGPPDW
jgi:Flp pilus assembly protein TadB